MRCIRPASILLLSLLLAAVAVADPVSGTVTNGTTGKPAPGVAVTLVDPMGGMAELATAKSDAQGRFKFDAPAAQGPRLVRAEKGGVNYFKMITPGSTSVDLSVYDAAASVEGISGSADVLRIQTEGSTLQADELFAINNQSSPPRTLASAATFEFVLPDGAKIDGAQAQAPNGQPIAAKPTPTKEKNHYAFSFALKPGETRLQVAYHLPYGGKASFTPRLTRNFEHYVLILPSSMTFLPSDAKQFQAMANRPGSNVQVSLQAKSGQDLSYAIAGSGTVPDEQANGHAPSGGDGAMGGGASADANRPGGGLGKPIDAPDGLAKYRWYILGALLTLLFGGGVWTREKTKQTEGTNEPLSSVALQSAPRTEARATSPEPANLLLTALKEELFELEIERQQGKLTPDEYDKARAALEQTLQRALARNRK
jgi:ribosomal protein L29